MARSDIFSKLQGIQPHQRNRVIFAVSAGVFVLILIVGFLLNILSRDPDKTNPERIKLVIWDPIDNEEAYREMIQNYRRDNPYIEIEYINVKIEESGVDIGETYRKKITEALAEGEGPDIYLIENTWLNMEGNRIRPMNPSAEPTEYVEYLPEEGTAPAINAAEIIGEYPDVVRFDFTREENGETVIYALPLFIDTLALYYNTDYFNSHNILNPPGTLEEFVDYAKRIRVLGENGEVKLSGAALGAADTHGVIRGGDNVNNAADIVSLLMLQAGAKMNDQFGRVSFDDPVTRGEDKFFPARDAFTFYTSFADKSSENYTWDPDGFFNVDAFGNATAAMMINYSNHIRTIRDKNPNLNFKVASMPQPAERFDKVNYADYWGLTVARVSKNPEAAWDLISFMAKAENAKSYLDKTKKPPALKSLIENYQADPEMRIFANQILTARSWMQPNPFETENILNDAIKEILKGGTGNSLTTIVNNAQNKINSLR